MTCAPDTTVGSKFAKYAHVYRIASMSLTNNLRLQKTRTLPGSAREKKRLSFSRRESLVDVLYSHGGVVMWERIRDR